MKAPDVIYFDQHTAHYNYESRNLDDVTYIRKEALLEWAKKCFRLQDSGSWYSKGAADAFSKVIDKLNEM